MAALFRSQLSQAREEGHWQTVKVALLGVGDALGRGVYERWRPRIDDPHEKRSGREKREEGKMEGLRRDFAMAVRSLRRAPGFTAAVVLTLALGIGANSAFFSVLDGVVLRPLPFPDPARFVHLRWDRGPGAYGALTAFQFEYWRDNSQSFEAVATYRSFLGRVDEGDHVDGVTSLRVTRGFLGVLGFSPAKGRDFTDSDDVPDGPRVALVSQRVWRDYLDGAPDVVGRTLRLNEEQYTVVGILPEDFAFPLWVAKTPSAARLQAS